MLLWSGGRSGLVLVRLPRGAWARLLDEAACRWATVEEREEPALRSGALWEWRDE